LERAIGYVKGGPRAWGKSSFLRDKEHLNMSWLHLLSWFFGGAFLANAVPHFVSGVTGRSFQTPFAKPPGEGLSSSTVNVCWGMFNALIGYLLVFRVGDFDLRSTLDVAVSGLGAVSISVFAAQHFGRFHGGNLPEGS
jgi:hypothetical protein